MTRTTRILALIATTTAVAVSAPLAQAADRAGHQADAVAPNPACFRCYVVSPSVASDGVRYRAAVPHAGRWGRGAS